METMGVCVLYSCERVRRLVNGWYTLVMPDDQLGRERLKLDVAGGSVVFRARRLH